ncbi:MAG: flagellar biosynthetic protein FliR [Thermoguttaceae bacterium]
MTPLSCEVIRIFVLIYARCIGALLVVPMFPLEGMRLLKWVVCFFLSLLVCPSLVSKVDLPWLASPLCDIPALIFLLVGIGVELFLGVIVGLCLKVFFQAFYLAGELISRVSGFSVVNSFDATLGSEASALSSLFYWFSLVIFILLGGMESFFDGLLAFFSLNPPGQTLVSDDFLFYFLSILANSFVFGVKLSIPIVLTSFVVYVGLGLNAKLFSQNNLAFLCFNLTSFFSLIVLFLIWETMESSVRSYILDGLGSIFVGTSK